MNKPPTLEEALKMWESMPADERADVIRDTCGTESSCREAFAMCVMSRTLSEDGKSLLAKVRRESK